MTTNSQPGTHLSAEHRTPEGLRRRVLSAVDSALREHYGDNYSARCVQASQAVTNLLGRCGTQATPVRGEACMAQVIGDRVMWLSFGGTPERDHCWVVTQHGELVDLTIWQHHLAPGSEPGGIPGPALWWDDATHLPPFCKYLYSGDQSRIAVVFANRDEDERFRRFLETAEWCFEHLAVEEEPIPLPFPVLASVDDMDRLREAGDVWMSTLWTGQLPPLPLWAQLSQ